MPASTATSGDPCHHRNNAPGPQAVAAVPVLMTVSRTASRCSCCAFSSGPRRRFLSGLMLAIQVWPTAQDGQPVMRRQAVSPTKTWLSDASQMGATPPCRPGRISALPTVQIRCFRCDGSMEVSTNRSWPDLDCQSVRRHHVGLPPGRLGRHRAVHQARRLPPLVYVMTTVLFWGLDVSLLLDTRQQSEPAPPVCGCPFCIYVLI